MKSDGFNCLSRRELIALGGVSALSLALTGCGGGGSAVPVGRSVVVQWSDVALQAIRVTKPGPPMVARMMAMTHTAIFDAWAAYDAVAVGTRLAGTLRRPLAERTQVNKTKAISFAAYRTLIDLFPTQTTLFNTQMTLLGYDINDVSLDVTTPSGIGNKAAAALLSFRHGDGSNQLGDLHAGAYSDYTGYVPKNDPDHINDPNHWQPLRFSDGHGGTVTPGYIGPHWGNVVPFAMTTGSQFRPSIALPQFGSPEYLQQAQEIIDYSANLTDDQKLQTEYFADGPKSELPPGHWCLFAAFISGQRNMDFDANVKLFFIVANAVMDAGIACWDTKRAYDYVRPLTAIHYAFKGQTIRAWGGPGLGAVNMLGESFGTFQSPTFITPPFPEFPSGHSTFSAAAAEVLKRFTGSDHLGFSVNFLKGSSALEPGITPANDVSMTFNTCSDAAEAAGLSRRYGGIHFVTGDLQGRQMGRSVGGVVWNKAQGYINGTA